MYFCKIKSWFVLKFYEFLTLNLTVKPLLKLIWLCLDSFSWNLENREASTEKTKSSISIKIWYFYCLNHSLFYGPPQLDKSCFQKMIYVNCVMHCFKFDVTLLYTNCCTIWNLKEYQLLLTVIIPYNYNYFYNSL